MTASPGQSLPDYPLERTFDDDTHGTLVIEDGVIPRRVRRPADLIRLSLAILGMAVLVAVAYFLSATSTGIEQDVTQVSGRLPSFLLLALNVIGALGLLGLPIAAAIDLLVRKRGRQLVEAIGAMVVATALAVLIAALVALWGSSKLLLALTGTDEPAEVFVLNPLIVGLVAFITVARLLGRGRWGVFAVITVVAVSVGPDHQRLVDRRGDRPLPAARLGSRPRRPLRRWVRRPHGRAASRWPTSSSGPACRSPLLRADRHTARGRQYSAIHPQRQPPARRRLRPRPRGCGRRRRRLAQPAAARPTPGRPAASRCAPSSSTRPS